MSNNSIIIIAMTFYGLDTFLFAKLNFYIYKEENTEKI